MYIGIDLGTTNIKALLVTASGEVVGRGSAPVGLIHTPDGGVEQDIEEIWSATVDAMSELASTSDVSGAKGIGISAQGGALQIKNWWWELDVHPTERMRRAIHECFQQFLAYLETESLQLDDALARQEGIEWLVPERRCG